MKRFFKLNEMAVPRDIFLSKLESYYFHGLIIHYQRIIASSDWNIDLLGDAGVNHLQGYINSWKDDMFTYGKGLHKFLSSTKLKAGTIQSAYEEALSNIQLDNPEGSDISEFAIIHKSLTHCFSELELSPLARRNISKLAKRMESNDEWATPLIAFLVDFCPDKNTVKPLSILNNFINSIGE